MATTTKTRPRIREARTDITKERQVLDSALHVVRDPGFRLASHDTGRTSWPGSPSTDWDELVGPH
jgi:hypothetical protein